MNATPRYIRTIRKFALSMLVLAGTHLYAQFDCTIFPGDTTVCYGQYISLVTAYDTAMNYSWEPSSGNLPYVQDIEVKDTLTYIVHVYNDDSTVYCSDTVTISIYPRIAVEFEQITKGCPDECKAQVIATASGGFPPYHYLWSAVVEPNDSTLALGLCSDQSYNIRVEDTVCIFDTAFLVKPYTMPEIEITMSPDSLFETNPQALFSFENKSADSIPLTNWVWVFPDSTTTNLLNPKYVFNETDSVLFIYTTIDGCIDTIITAVDVQPFKLIIYNVFTPNGDGVNDKYEIPYLDRYISNQLIVYNRWGEMVYKGDNYSGDWDGGKLPDGVYFYILKCQGYWKEDVFRGSVSIYGSKY
jgi:gliding motility-associated-like protein